MQFFTAEQDNTLYADVVARATGIPITTGTVVGYLQAVDGDHAGKWWDSATESWLSIESSAGNMSHVSDGHWKVVVDALAWDTGVRYHWYWKETGDLHISCSEDIVEGHPQISFEATITD